jgi:hypothetical protein
MKTVLTIGVVIIIILTAYKAVNYLVSLLESIK